MRRVAPVRLAVTSTSKWHIPLGMLLSSQAGATGCNRSVVTSPSPTSASVRPKSCRSPPPSHFPSPAVPSSILTGRSSTSLQHSDSEGVESDNQHPESMRTTLPDQGSRYHY